jgi:hypothetical protein
MALNVVAGVHPVVESASESRVSSPASGLVNTRDASTSKQT